MAPRWNSADMAPRTTPGSPAPIAAPVSPVAGCGADTGPELRPAFGEPAGPCTYLVGPYAVQRGGRLHQEQLADRERIVITGPLAEGLAVAVVAAVEAFLSATRNAQAGHWAR